MKKLINKNMNNKCPSCGTFWDKKLIDSYKVILPKNCPGCRKQAPRASMRPINPVRKPKAGK